MAGGQEKKDKKEYVTKILLTKIFEQNIKSFFSYMFKILKIFIVQIILLKYIKKKFFIVHKFKAISKDLLHIARTSF